MVDEIGASAVRRPPNRLGLDRPSVARMYDYYLGGKNNFKVDRELASEVLRRLPQTRIGALSNRQFLSRAVRFLAAEAGVRQFLDLGSGLPMMDNVHEVAWRQADGMRVVYVDNDPVVAAHTRALAVTDHNDVAMVQEDLRDVDAVLGAARGHLDFDRPIALTAIATLHYIGGDDDPYAIVDAYLDALPPGSYLSLTHAVLLTAADVSEETLLSTCDLLRQWGASARAYMRSSDEIRRFFARTELVEPGLVYMPQWRPDGGTGWRDRPEETFGYGGVGRITA